jgi:hypothetical protein
MLSDWDKKCKVKKQEWDEYKEVMSAGSLLHNSWFRQKRRNKIQLFYHSLYVLWWLGKVGGKSAFVFFRKCIIHVFCMARLKRSTHKAAL